MTAQKHRPRLLEPYFLVRRRCILSVKVDFLVTLFVGDEHSSLESYSILVDAIILLESGRKVHWVGLAEAFFL